MKRRSSVDEVDTAQERQEGQGLKWRRCLLGDPCAVLNKEGTLWREGAGAVSLAMLRRGI